MRDMSESDAQGACEDLSEMRARSFALDRRSRNRCSCKRPSVQQMGVTERQGDEMLEGYLDGMTPNSPEPSGNRSASYRHGFLNGRDDMSHKPRDSAAKLRIEAELASDLDARR
jgi:hypothetical protein